MQDDELPVSLVIGAFAKLRKATISFVILDFKLHYVCPSARPHGTTRLPLDGFSRNLIIGRFLKPLREYSDFINI
jgi:hypothetical protein